MEMTRGLAPPPICSSMTSKGRAYDWKPDQDASSMRLGRIAWPSRGKEQEEHPIGAHCTHTWGCHTPSPAGTWTPRSPPSFFPLRQAQLKCRSSATRRCCAPAHPVCQPSCQHLWPPGRFHKCRFARQRLQMTHTRYAGSTLPRGYQAGCWARSRLNYMFCMIIQRIRS